MYPPPIHQEGNFENAIRTIKTFPLATLITPGSEIPLSSHLPLIFYPNEKFGKLVGHIDNNNPQVHHLKGNIVQAIFHGPDTYISPTIYDTDQLPTWNYIKVHVWGKVRLIDSEEKLKISLVNMSKYLEHEDSSYKLDYNDQKMESLIKFIQGFELDIEKWDGKYKLSQNKNSKDRESAKNALKSNYSENINSYIDVIHKNHMNKAGLSE